MEDVAKNRSDAVELAGANNQMGGGVQHHLQATGDLIRSTQPMQLTQEWRLVVEL